MLLDKQLLRQTRNQGLALLFTVVPGLISALFIILQSYQVAEIIHGAFFLQIPPESMTARFIWLGVAILLRSAFQFITEYRSSRLGVNIKAQLRLQMIDKLRRLGPNYAGGERAGEVTMILTEGIEALDPYFSQYIPQLIFSAFIPVIILGFVLPFDLLSFAILAVTAPLLPFFMSLLGSMSEKSTSRQWHLLTKLGTFFYESLQGLTLLISLNKAGKRGNEILRYDAEYRQLTMDVLKLTFLSAFVLEFISTISTAVIAVQIGLRLLNGSLTFQTALFILLLAPEFYLPLRQLGLRFHAGMTGRAAAIKIFGLLNTDETTEAQATIPIDPVVAIRLRQEGYFPIIFNNVSASYLSRQTEAVKDITFTINELDQVVLVGASGSGKTTITYLLMGLLKPAAGEVKFNGISHTHLSPEDYSRLVSWVPQSPYLFAGSILENISMHSKSPDMEKIMQAARAARLDSFIDSLPEDYYTMIGEGANRLSRGQAQRLALARAFYKDTPLLVMDEPTSSIDPETESELIQSLETLRHNRTVLMIAHRYATIREGARVLFVQDGRIVDSGTHSQLKASNIAYAGFTNPHIGKAGL